MDPPEWNKFITVRQENGTVKAGELPFNYWLLPPICADLRRKLSETQRAVTGPSHD